jgi:hypothetical protein
MPVALILLATVVGISALQSILTPNKNNDGSSSSSSSGAPSPSTQVLSKEDSSTKEADNDAAIASFRKKMMAAPDADKLFRSYSRSRGSANSGDKFLV